MKTKTFLFIVLMAFGTSFLFAQRNVYAGADKKTQAVIKKADNLIEQRKYATAFGSLSTDNEFQIA